MKTLDELLSELRQRDVKLWLEGERLRYRAAKDSLTPELLNELKTQKAEIINFLRQVTTVASSKIPPIVACERNGNLPLSFGQQRIWFLHQFEPNSSSNNMPVVVRFTGNLNVAVLEESLREVIRRHEVLRTTFPAVNGKPTQVIATDVSLTLPVIDLQQVADEQRETEAHILATKEAHQPFDLANGPILRVLLLKLSDREHLLIWNMHCIVCDGASSDVFYQDLTTIYKALSAGQPSPLPPLPVQYADFTHWQYQWLQGEVLESQVNYWKQKLDGNLPIIDLPYDYPRPQGAQTYRGDRAALLLPKALNYALTDLSQKWGATLFMTLLTVFELLLYRYSGQEDLLVSFASASRGQVETERLIGFFSNTLVLRSNLAGNPTFRELLDRVRKDCLEAYSHQDLPFERLIEELKPEQQSRNTSSLFQVKFSLNPPWSNGRGMASVELPDLTITSLFGYIYHGKTKYDLTLVLREQDNGLGMVFDYNAEMFDASTVERMLGHYKTLLEGIVANPDQPISELPLLTASEQQLLVDWHGKQADYPQDICIHQYFEAQVKRTPNNIAVSFANQQLTYQELNHRANQLAHYLQTLGVGVGVNVGLYLEPSLETIVGLLGILKAGGTSVAIAPKSGAEILADAQVSFLLTQSSLVEKIPEHQAKVICINTELTSISLHSTDNLVCSETRSEIPLGKAIANTQVYILDKRSQLLPIGVTGEIYIGGIGITQGYFNLPELTSEKFIPNPFSSDSGAYLYKTGDLGRYLSDGNIQFLGSLDHQVKISQNLTNTQIEKTFVPPQDSLQIQLTEIWQNFLGIHPIGITDNFFDLGGHSLIAVRLFAEIEKTFGKTLPLSILLQAPTIEQFAHFLRDKSPVSQPNSEQPLHLVKDFFGKAISKVFKGENSQQISEENQTNLETREWLPSSSLVPLQPNGKKLPLFCVHGAGESVLYYRDFAKYLGTDQPVYALQAIGVDGKKAPLTRVEKMAAHYIKEIQTIQPQGPYFLGGYSFGGLVVWEMARQLAAQGQKVALLALFDTSNTTRLQTNIKPIPTQKRISRHLHNLLEIGPEYILQQIEGKRSWIDYMVKRKLNKLTFKAYLNISRFLPYTYRNQVKIKDFNKQAAKEYVPKAYVGRVTVFRAEERPANNGGVVDPNMGWGELALGGLDIQHVPGNHFSIFNEPYVKSLSEKMKVCIEQAMAKA
ncbi:AMP-binding protein [Calothrix sp. FACHB-156]|nr:AMP-binding protein [Calothrix sp. FACHB-156]